MHGLHSPEPLSIELSSEHSDEFVIWCGHTKSSEDKELELDQLGK